MAIQHQIGKDGEASARIFLEEQGYRVLTSNYRCPVGEIDLVCEDGKALVFVEVKARTQIEKGTPEEAVTLGKQRKLYRVAEWYLSQVGYRGERPTRFDVVSILWTIGCDHPSIKLYRNAFQL